ncbi:periplasmic heavy metal sensor, partial [Acinetobacter baumannii]
CLYHFKWSNPPGNFNNRQQLGLRFAAKLLSEEQQKTFKRALRETRLKANDLSETANDDRDKARKIIADNDFDKQKLQEELN